MPLDRIDGSADDRARREQLSDFLDWYRGVAEGRLDGLTRVQATSVTTPSGTNMLSIVKHLAWVEHCWFREHLLGDPGRGLNSTSSYALDEVDTVASVIDEYRAACADSRQVLARDIPLDQVTSVTHHFFGPVTLEWILLHMIEETARHSGHLDILRELTDGRTG